MQWMNCLHQVKMMMIDPSCAYSEIKIKIKACLKCCSKVASTVSWTFCPEQPSTACQSIMQHSTMANHVKHMGMWAHVTAQCIAAHNMAEHSTALQSTPKIGACCVGHLWSLPFTEGSMACTSSDRNVLGLLFP